MYILECVLAAVLALQTSSEKDRSTHALVNRVNQSAFSTLQHLMRRFPTANTVAFSPITYWQLYGALFATTPTEGPFQSAYQRQRSRLAAALAFSPAPSQNEVLESLGYLRAIAHDDGVTLSTSFWVDPHRSSLKLADRSTYESLQSAPADTNFEDAGTRARLDAWSTASTQGVLPELLDEFGQFEPSYTTSIYATAVVFSASLQPTPNGFSNVGRGYYPNGAGQAFGTNTLQRVEYYSGNIRGIQGVKLLDPGKGLRAYFFIGKDRENMRRFLGTLNPDSFTRLKGDFSARFGNLAIGFSLRSQILQDIERESDEYVTFAGTSPYGPSLRSVATLSDGKFVATSVGAITTSACCWDYLPEALHQPTFDFALSSVAVVIEDKRGMILFLGY